VRTTSELRHTILAAARAEFARYGLAGARIDRIARAAEASHAQQRVLELEDELTAARESLRRAIRQANR